MSEDEIPEGSLTTEEEQELNDSLGYNYPRKQEKDGLMAFFSKILRSKDTTKTSYLDEEELRAVRVIQSAANYSKEMGLHNVEKFIREEGEIILATANSKGGFLVNAAITKKSEFEAKTKQVKGGSKGWPKKG